MRGIRMDLERMQFAIQNRDGRGYVPPSRQEIGIQADEVRPEVQEPKPKKKKDTSIKEIDPEVKVIIQLFHVLPVDFMFVYCKLRTFTSFQCHPISFYVDQSY